MSGMLAAALMTLGATLAATTPASATSCLPGSGTASDPFLVASAADLAKVGADAPNGCTLVAHYLQTADITLAAPIAPATSNHTPIGEGVGFSGVYDGAGHTISGLRILVTNIGDTGLFDSVRASGGSSGLVTGVNLTDASVRSNGGFNTALLVGVLVDSEIRDSHVEGDVTSDRNALAGLVGYSLRGTIRRVSADVTVTAVPGTTNDWVAGLVGYAESSLVEDATASVSVTNRSIVADFTGGLIGSAQDSTIRRVAAYGTVDGYKQVGGLIGGTTGSTSLTSSFAAVDVSGEDDLGGLVGWFIGLDARDVYARGEVSGGTLPNQVVGGLVGGAANASIQRAFSTGTVFGSGQYIGGMIGISSSPRSIADAYWDAQTSGQSGSAGGTGATTAQLTSIGVYAGWPMVEGWAPYHADVLNGRIWGICPRVNDGYPFLLWEYDADPCTVPVAEPTVTLTCEAPIVAGETVTCAVSDGPLEFDFVWRAAYNPKFAEGVVRTGADGTGTFSFRVPPAAAGSPVTVELVDWLAPVSLGRAGGPVPTSVPSGEGPVTKLSLVLLLLVGGLVVVSRSRRASDALRRG